MNFKEQAQEILYRHLEQWENNPQRMASGYDYEYTFGQMVKQFENELLQLSVGQVPKSKNTKKNSKPIMVK